MSATVWRCPDCGCLAYRYARAHRRDCLFGVTPADEIANAEEARA